jgi:eukaryotic-like serine/threonine-protein kinase
MRGEGCPRTRPWYEPGVERIGRYVLERPLGEGALAVVHLARDEKLFRQVAVKVLRFEVADEDVRRRFQLEARAIASLEHPNVVRLYDYSDDDSPVLYLVMEHVPGPSLGHILQQRGPFAEQVALCIAHEVCSALTHAHEKGAVHRDIKPSNILLHEGRVVLIDFGVMKVVESSAKIGPSNGKHTTRAVGTPGYMAPEQFLGKGIDARTDVFAVGALLYNLATGALPYEGHDVETGYEAARSGKYRDPRDLQPLLTAGFCELLTEALAASAADRPQSAEALRHRVAMLLAHHGIEDPLAELERYCADPDAHAVAIQSRSADVLVRDLKHALLCELNAVTRAKDEQRMKLVAAQLRHVTMLDERFADTEEAVRPAKAMRTTSRWRRYRWAVMGFLLGAMVSAGLTAVREGALRPSWPVFVLRAEP